MEENPFPSSSSSPFLEFKSPNCHSKTQKFQLTSFLIYLTFLLLTTPTRAATAAKLSTETSDFRVSYSRRCHDVVPESPSTGTHLNFSVERDKILYFDIAYFTGAGLQTLLGGGGGSSSGVSLSFHPKRKTIYLTETSNVVELQASLKFYLPTLTWRRNLRMINYRAPKFPVRRQSVAFDLHGFWEMGSGKLCMVGSGSGSSSSSDASKFNVVLKLDYPVDFSNYSSLISGMLESLDLEGSLSYFKPISILGVPHHGEYRYTLVEKGNGDLCLGGDDGGGEENENLGVELTSPSTCLTQLYKYARSFELEYGDNCGNESGGSKCNPLGEKFGVLPQFMTIQGVQCEQGSALRILIGFSNSADDLVGALGYNRVFDPNNMLIGEGAWDEKRNRLCVVACRILSFKDSLANASVADCSIRLSLRFPRTLTIMHRSTVVGQIFSNKTVDSAGYFSSIRFHGSGNRIRRHPGPSYEYTMLDRVSRSCPETKTLKGKGKTYPSAYSYDMRFDMSVRNGKGETSRGSSSPLFVGNQLYEPYWMNNRQTGLLNISYKMSFTTTSSFKLGNKVLSNESVEILAEGTYNNRTGFTCMVGCWRLKSAEKPIKNVSLDCEILVHLQYSPVNAKGKNNVEGTIESMRPKSDPLHFEQIKISSNSIYARQAADSIWRMDMEITMVLISNTLACLFVGLQLYHVKKHPDVLSFISLLMLLVLTLGYMIPLVLNFEALFTANHNRQNVFLESGGWVEVNEVIIRVVTMVVFLLQFRLLQLTWSARQSDRNCKSLWLAEKRVIYVSLPLYICGGLIAWYVHQWKNAYKNPYLLPRQVYKQHYSWRDLKSYAGLVLDVFLFPQIMFNLFLNPREYTLASPFYMGTTLVHLLPHAYDLYRAHSSAWYLDLSYIYANHRQDFYSTAWDIVIPAAGLLLASVIYVQQRFGGRCIFPKRFRETLEYEKVPVVSGEEGKGIASAEDSL